MYLDRLALHAHGEALVVAAVLAAVAVALVDGAVLAPAAGVREALAHHALEEPLAALTAAGQRLQPIPPTMTSL